MIDTSSKKRHELHESRIRALYGHSIPGKLEKKKANPPVLLFHGTDPSILERILKEGLLPMGRQYVHLSVNIEIAREVGKRKTKKPVVLSIAAEKAYNDGIAFYIGNDKVWLADQIPCSYITVSFNNNCDSTSAVARHVRRGKSVISNGLKSHSGKD
jgi:putative RNA 2'-phosphotransferase